MDTWGTASVRMDTWGTASVRMDTWGTASVRMDTWGTAVRHTENVAWGANWEFPKCKGVKCIQCINFSKV